MSTIDHRLHCGAWRLTRREAAPDGMDADRRQSPWSVSAIGGAFAPNAAFLPVVCVLVFGSMGRCTDKNRYGAPSTRTESPRLAGRAASVRAASVRAASVRAASGRAA